MNEILLAIPLGIATGVLLGLLGAGGSVLTVPALVYLLGEPVGAATTAALAIVSGNAAVGAADNVRRGTVDRRVAVQFAAGGVCGALLGSYLNRLASGETILFLLALVMLGAAWPLWRGRSPADVARAAARRRAPVALVGSVGVLVGTLTGFFGVGGGFLIVPALILLLDVPVRSAVGTSLVIITVTALAGLAGHLSAGEVSWPVTLAFGAAGVVGVLLGTRASRRFSGAGLSRAFAVMLVLVAALLLVENGIALVG